MTIEQHIPPQNIRINNKYMDKDLYKSLHIHIRSSNQEISNYVNVTMSWSQTLQEREMFKSWLQDPNIPRILFFHDSIEGQKKKGDIGKTWLLKNRQDIAMQHCPELIIVSTDFFFEHIHIVIIDCNTLDWIQPNRKGCEREIQTGAFSPLNQEEMTAYYTIDTHSKQTKALYKHIEGRPILIGPATDILNKHILRLEHLATIPLRDFESHLVMQINNPEHPLNWTILFMAHAYHRFNFELLNYLLEKANLKYLSQDVQFNKLVIDLLISSFVCELRHGEDFVLHDKRRRILSKGMFLRLYIETNILLTDGKPITKWDIEEVVFQHEHKSLLALHRLFFHILNEQQEQLAIQSFEMKKPQTRVQEALEQ
jgi:hypothetical protein